jgi:hypothetical protein
MNPPRPQKGRKLLIASLGLATASYLGCDGIGGETSGNLLPPPINDGGSETKPPDTWVGNLLPPPPNDAGKEVGAPDAEDARTDAPDGSGDGPKDVPPEMILPPVGNLLPPPRFDAAPDAKDGASSSKADDKKADRVA